MRALHAPNTLSASFWIASEVKERRHPAGGILRLQNARALLTVGVDAEQLVACVDTKASFFLRTRFLERREDTRFYSITNRGTS
jgi:hypothetical protein